MPGFVYVILIGTILGYAARLVCPGPLHGFILTTLLGTAGTAAATYLGRLLHVVEPDHLADLVTMFVGSVVVLFLWNQFVTVFVVDKTVPKEESNAP